MNIYKLVDVGRNSYAGFFKTKEFLLNDCAVDSANLLTKSEYTGFKSDIPLCEESWWLQDVSGGKASYVGFDGEIASEDVSVDSDYLQVRPVIHFSTVSDGLKKGDSIRIGDNYFEMLSFDLAICSSCIGFWVYDSDLEIDDYADSEIKLFVDSWFRNNVLFK